MESIDERSEELAFAHRMTARAMPQDVGIGVGRAERSLRKRRMERG